MGEIGPDRFIPCVVPPEYVNSCKTHEKRNLVHLSNGIDCFFLLVYLLINVFWLVNNPLMVKLETTQKIVRLVRYKICVNSNEQNFKLRIRVISRLKFYVTHLKRFDVLENV